MKINFLIIFLFIISSIVHAADSNHLISIGTDGFGWNGAAGVLKWDQDKSEVEDNSITTGNLAFNYAYIFDGGFMLGFAASAEMETNEIKVNDGEKVKSEESTSSLALILGYNFGSNLNHSWWIKTYIGSSTVKEKTTDETDPSNNSETSSTSSDLILEFGKRFSLSSWGLDNVTYAPSFEYGTLIFSGDLKESGAESLTGFQLNVLKVDVLF